jgi:hypothetical protein
VDFFDGFVDLLPEHGLQSLMLPTITHNLGSRSRASSVNGSTTSRSKSRESRRAPRSKRGSKKVPDRTSSRGSTRSKAPVVQPSTAVVVEEGPFKDPTRYIFEKLQERENTRDMRDARSLARKAELRLQLQEDEELHGAKT